MNFFPKRTKFNKMRKGTLGHIDCRSTQLSFGVYGIQALECGRVTARQIEAARKAINRRIKRSGKLWIRIFPDIPVTSKPTEVRMGKGKGGVDFWACKVPYGKVLFELEGIPFEIAKEALMLGSDKLSVKTKLISK